MHFLCRSSHVVRQGYSYSALVSALCQWLLELGKTLPGFDRWRGNGGRKPNSFFLFFLFSSFFFFLPFFSKMASFFSFFLFLSLAVIFFFFSYLVLNRDFRISGGAPLHVYTLCGLLSGFVAVKHRWLGISMVCVQVK